MESFTFKQAVIFSKNHTKTCKWSNAALEKRQDTFIMLWKILQDKMLQHFPIKSLVFFEQMHITQWCLKLRARKERMKLRSCGYFSQTLKTTLCSTWSVCGKVYYITVSVLRAEQLNIKFQKMAIKALLYSSFIFNKY